MKNGPKVFGFPLWVNVTKRLKAKRKDVFSIVPIHWKNGWLPTFTKGSLVSDCTGLNDRIVSLSPIYLHIGRKAKVLIDVDVELEKNSCSAKHCGINLPKTISELEDYRQHTINIYKEKDDWGFADKYSKIVINPDGTYTVFETKEEADKNRVSL